MSTDSSQRGPVLTGARYSVHNWAGSCKSVQLPKNPGSLVKLPKLYRNLPLPVIQTTLISFQRAQLSCCEDQILAYLWPVQRGIDVYVLASRTYRQSKPTKWRWTTMSSDSRTISSSGSVGIRTGPHYSAV